MALLQWNIRGFRSHRPDLRHLLSSYNPSIVCLQETFLTHPPVPIPNYHFVSLPHSIFASSILVHHKTPYIIPPLQTTIPCTVIRIFLRRWITIISVYFSPSLPIDFLEFETLLSQLQPPFLIAGDFNCRHTHWGDSIINTRGRSLEQFLTKLTLSS